MKEYLIIYIRARGEKSEEQREGKGEKVRNREKEKEREGRNREKEKEREGRNKEKERKRGRVTKCRSLRHLACRWRWKSRR